MGSVIPIEMIRIEERGKEAGEERRKKGMKKGRERGFALSQFLAIKGENTCLMMQKQKQNHNTGTEKKIR